MKDKRSFKKSLIATSVLAGLASMSTSHSMMVDESAFGDFSNDSLMPTLLPGATGVTGEFGIDIMDSDYVRLTGLPTGVQTFKLETTVIQEAFGQQFEAFQNNGSESLVFFNLDSDVSTTFQTFANFDGSLDVRFFPEGGGGYITYSVELHPVPIPPTALLFASGLGVLSVAKVRRKAKRRT